MKPAKAPPAAPAPEGVSFVDRNLPLDQLFESSTNPRGPIKAKFPIDDLIESVRQFGVLVPLIVTPAAAGDDIAKCSRFTIVAGARRFRTAAHLKLKEVPCRIARLTTAQILEMQLFENLQREGVDPFYEAEHLQLLLAQPGYSMERLVQRSGKTDGRYIAKRLRLLELIPEARDAYRAELIGLELCGRIARLHDQANQKLAFEECFPWQWKGDKRIHDTTTQAQLTTSQLDAFIDREILRNLSGAPWKLSDAELLPKAGPCTTCPKNTAANLALSDQPGKGQGHCTDGGCFKAKTEAHIDRRIQAAAANNEQLIRVSTDWHRDPKHKSLPSSGQYKRIRDKKERCEHTTRAIAAAGLTEVGTEFDVCIEPTCEKHHKRAFNPGSSRSKTSSGASRDAQRTSEVNHEIERLAKTELLQQILGRALDHVEERAVLTFVCGWLANEQGSPSDQFLEATGAKFKASLPFQKKQSMIQAAIKQIVGRGRGVALMLAIAADLSYTTDDYVAAAKAAGLNWVAIEKKVGDPLRAKLATELEATKSKAATKKKTPAKAAAKKKAVRK